jgi:hypothetical protein
VNRQQKVRDMAEQGPTDDLGRRGILLGGGAVLTGLLLEPSSVAIAAGTAQPPNIIYIIADDLGWKDVGFHGSDVKTPNLDRLADTGVELEEFYVQPVCTPTRAALLTGRYPMRYGLQTGAIPSGAAMASPPTNGSCRRPCAMPDTRRH